MKEAILYEKLESGEVKCGVCSHRCRIRDGKRGVCGVRENHGGTLYTLNYGITIAAANDPMEKKPLYHFMPGTRVYSFAAAGCNLRCMWCQNWQISQSPKPDKIIIGEPVSPEEHVQRALDWGCPSIAYTYSEPTIFLEYALDTMKLAREKGLKNVWHTNGFMTTETLELIIPYLDAANVDLKGPKEGVYEKYCGGKAEPVMRNIVQLYKAGVHLEITTLIIPGLNDQVQQLEEMANFLAKEVSPDVAWHITRFFPAYKMPDTPITPLETLQMAKKIGEKAGLKYIHIGNV